jgi:hypothetical protein
MARPRVFFRRAGILTSTLWLKFRAVQPHYEHHLLDQHGRLHDIGVLPRQHHPRLPEGPRNACLGQVPRLKVGPEERRVLCPSVGLGSLLQVGLVGRYLDLARRGYFRPVDASGGENS